MPAAQRNRGWSCQWHDETRNALNAIVLVEDEVRELVRRRGLDPAADPAGGVRIAIHDEEARPRLELTFDATAGYESRGGVEFPADGLRVTGVWDTHEELVTPRQDAIVRAS